MKQEIKQLLTWRTSQKLELEYVKSIEDSRWLLRGSLEYWKTFLNLKNIDGQGIEVGCGKYGIYNFVPNIVGIDSLNFHKHNFIRSTAEHLPFKKIDFIICTNALDHCINPQRVLNEIADTTDNLVLWVYVYPKIVSFLLSKFDKLHPHHLTRNTLNNLLKNSNFKKTEETFYSPLNHTKYTKEYYMKLKLLIAHLLNIRGMCIHLTKSITTPQNLYIYNINKLQISMFTDKPYEKIEQFRITNIKRENDLEFYIGKFSPTLKNFIQTNYHHKLSSWKIQLQNFNKPLTTVYFKGDFFFSRNLFFTMIFEPLLQYKHIKKHNIVLHASSIAYNNRSYIFSGDATIGKTSILMHFLSKGYRYLSDDQAVVNMQTLNILPYILPIGINLKLAIKTHLTLPIKTKLSLFFQTLINFCFLNYTHLTTDIPSEKLQFGKQKALFGKPTKLHKIFILTTGPLLITKLSPDVAAKHLWKSKFGSRSKLPALIYYSEEFKKKNPEFSLWKDYQVLLQKLVQEISVYKISFTKKYFPEAIKLIEQEIHSD